MKGAGWGQQKGLRGLAACAQRKLGNKPWAKPESHTRGCPLGAQHGPSMCLLNWLSQQPCRAVLTPHFTDKETEAQRNDVTYWT